MMLMIVGLLFISLNSNASEWSPAYSYNKQKDDPRAVIIEDDPCDPYGLSKSAPLKSSKNPLYVKEPLAEPAKIAVRKAKSESFAWDSQEPRNEIVFNTKKIGLLTKIKRGLSKSDKKLEKLKSASFLN